jgi:heterodisulfide reductase subunit A
MDVMKENTPIGAVMVIGGGIGGMQASLDLAESGFFVYLVDTSPTIGGVMAQLDKTFPTNDCSMCIMSPKLVETGRHLNVRILAHAEIDQVEGETGHFEVTVVKKPRYIHPDRCTGCGECAKHCPVSTIDTYNEKMSRRPAIYLRYPQAVPKVFLIDREKCIGCGLCERVCLAKAINYGDRLEKEKIAVGSIILAPGYEVFDARLRPEFGYGTFANVVTSLEFERLLSATGPHRGHLLRPSDGTIPERIAFIQCVGSRDTGVGNPYCSSICCMYATKEAIIAKEHVHFVKPTIFYMDLRAYGKGFDAYYERAKQELGIRFVPSMVSKVREQLKTKNLLVSYVNEEGKIVEEEFDLVVLSVGVTPSRGTIDMAKRMGVALDEFGFCKTSSFEPTATSRPGIYVCGAFEAPKDIPETVSQASGAVADATSRIAVSRGTQVVRKEYPPEWDVTNEEPRIGVFVCHCGINIGGVVNVPRVKEYARTLKNVAYAEENLYTCSQDTQEKMKKAIIEHRLNRVVVASCSPRTHEPLFRETLREVGLNPFLFEMANIRDQCSWVHMRQKAEATEKAKDLVRMAVANARLIRSLGQLSVPVVPKGLVIGGGVAGMVASLGLAEQGYEAYLVERASELGGNLRNLHTTLEQEDVQAYLNELIERTTGHPRIHVMTQSEVVSFSGSKGNFSTGVRVGPAKEFVKIDHGVTIVATGAEEWKPDVYHYGEDSRILTQLELERKIKFNPEELARAKRIVMIQCVGSRESARPYCSRTCCATAIKNGLAIKALNPHVRIDVLYRDMRTYGLMEPYYERARKEGILFVRYTPEEKPEVRLDGRLSVLFTDRRIDERLEIEADLLVLSAATVPRENEALARLLKVPRTAEGFFLEAHMKLRPADFATDGIYLAGSAHGPKLIRETIAQARAAVARACTILSKDKMLVGGVVAVVNGEKCAACLTCVRVCPYEVPFINTRGEAEIEVSRCKGCGTCVAECPARAIELMHFRTDQLEAKSQALLLEMFEV